MMASPQMGVSLLLIPPCLQPLASEGPRSKQRDNGRTICLLDSKQAARTLEGQKEGDESNCYKSQSSYLIKIFLLDFCFSIVIEARRAEKAMRFDSLIFVSKDDEVYKVKKITGKINIFGAKIQNMRK